MSPRERRLEADYESVKHLLRETTILTAEAKGNPPQHYRFRFRGWGVAQRRDGSIGLVDQHEVAVELGAAYPRMMPGLFWKTPIFHPNISSNGIVCLGGYGTHWVPSLTLSELCSMLWDIIRYRNFDPESPYNREAAAWARAQTEFRFPLDPRPLRDRLASEAAAGRNAGQAEHPRSPPPDIVFL